MMDNLFRSKIKDSIYVETMASIIDVNTNQIVWKSSSRGNKIVTTKIRGGEFSGYAFERINEIIEETVTTIYANIMM